MIDGKVQKIAKGLAITINSSLAGHYLFQISTSLRGLICASRTLALISISLH